MIDAIEASIAIPIIARPVMHQGRYFLDGGLWDCAPVDAASSSAPMSLSRCSSTGR